MPVPRPSRICFAQLTSCVRVRTYGADDGNCVPSRPMDWFRGQRERPAWYLELTLLVGGYLAFGLARAGVDRGDPIATSNSALVQRLEQGFHIAAEYPLNRNHPRGSPAAASSYMATYDILGGVGSRTPRPA